MSKLVNQPGPAPTRKVTAGLAGGGATAVLIWAVGLFGIDLPPEVAAELGAIAATLVSLIAAYFTRELAT